MSNQAIGMMLGGILAAVLYGFSGIFAKASNQAGIGLGWYLLISGLTIAMVGALSFVAVLLALWIFAEWKQVHVVRLLIGALLIVVGGTLVARS